MSLLDPQDAAAVQTLIQYLRIPSAHPDVDYGPCVDWLRAQASELDLRMRCEYPASPSKPLVVLTWPGSQPHQPSVLLNSHMDVVPVYPDKWTHAPFGGERTPDGRVFGRGAQDMKGVAVQYLEAVRRLKRQTHFAPKRSLHLVFAPDEEIGSHDGWEAFVRSPSFGALHVGFALDEGMPSPRDDFFFFHGERSNWKLEFVCRGTPGHGCVLMDNPAAQRVRVLLNHVMEFREQEKAKITSPLTHGLVTSVNVTMIQGGVLNNVAPPEVTVSVDARLAPAQDPDAFERLVRGWAAAAGDVEVRVVERGQREGVTPLADDNPWWLAFRDVFRHMGLTATPLICPGGTDARFLRRLGIPALGISMMNGTPLLLHDHDEFVHEEVFLRGIPIYMELLRSLTSL